jgi:phosphoribosylanthranilate isomerase
VQLHGEESVEYCKECKKEGFGVIKAFGIGEGFDFKQLTPFNSVVDFFLFDTKTASYGGSGKTFNWKLLQNYHLEKEYFLSGGISLSNLSELEKIDLEKVHALDVNSRFETEPGLKDPEMIAQFQSELTTYQSAIVEKSK